jgi:hypothetical protein
MTFDVTFESRLLGADKTDRVRSVGILCTCMFQMGAFGMAFSLETRPVKVITLDLRQINSLDRAKISCVSGSVHLLADKTAAADGTEAMAVGLVSKGVCGQTILRTAREVDFVGKAEKDRSSTSDAAID